MEIVGKTNKMYTSKDIKGALFDHLSDHTLLIVPNLRTARLLIHDYACIQHPKSHWASPPIVALETWLQTLTTQILEAPWHLLSNQQEASLWQNIVNDQTQGSLPYANTQSIAALAQSASGLLGDWCIDLEQLNHHPLEDIAFFYACAIQFQTMCKEQHWLPMANRNAFLLEHMTKYLPMIPSEIMLYGFDHLPPSCKQIFDQLSDTHTITTLGHVSTQGEQHQVICKDQNDEIRQMLNWAKQGLQSNPEQRLICLIPQLHLIRDKLVREVRQHITDADTTISVNVSSGKPSADYPIIAHALQLIHWLHSNEATQDTITELLCSPYIAGAHQELSQRALLDQQCRNQPWSAFNLTTMRQMAKQHHCPLFADICHPPIEAAHTQRSPSQWAEILAKTLEDAGWPGERNLDSQEYQLCKAWHTIVAQLASFDTVQELMSFDQAFMQLKSLCQDHLFQSQSHMAQLEILGTLEGSSIPCDQIWMMDMTDQLWPAKPQPHPFLPIQLQQQLDLPHASASKELAFSHAIMQRLSHNAKQVYYSYASHNGEQSQLPSPLLANLAVAQPSSIDIQGTQNTNNHALERFDDAMATAIHEPLSITAGSQLIQHQANCPFQAFGIHRLHAQDLMEAEKHITAADKGSLIHMALDVFWRETHDHSQLMALSAEALSDAIDQSIAQAFKLYARKLRHSMHPSLQPILQQNLHQLMQQWMALEKDRPYFKVVAQEEEIKQHLAGIPIILRPDRIDQLADGQYILIDYKTGQASHQHWLSERLMQTQLPLYAVSYPLSLDGLAFAHVKTHQCAYSGLINHTEGLPALTAFDSLYPDTPESAKPQQFAKWRLQLEELANEFLHGVASVTPHHAQSCQYCHLSYVCRVHS